MIIPEYVEVPEIFINKKKLCLDILKYDYSIRLYEMYKLATECKLLNYTWYGMLDKLHNCEMPINSEIEKIFLHLVNNIN